LTPGARSGSQELKPEANNIKMIISRKPWLPPTEYYQKAPCCPLPNDIKKPLAGCPLPNNIKKPLAASCLIMLRSPWLPPA